MNVAAKYQKRGEDISKYIPTTLSGGVSLCKSDGACTSKTFRFSNSASAPEPKFVLDDLFKCQKNRCK